MLLSKIPTPAYLIADRTSDAKKLRDWLSQRGCQPVIPPNPARKHPHSFDRLIYQNAIWPNACFAASRTSAK
jgi:hypothetical protein